MIQPNYVHHRFKEIGQNFRLRVLLVYVDDEDNQKVLCELNKICFVNDFTMILSWSFQEAARYIETLKVYESKAPDSIKERVETDFIPKLASVLTNVQSVNKTDVGILLNTFGSFKNICNARDEQLIMCPGLGEKKVSRLHRALHAPFEIKNEVGREGRDADEPLSVHQVPDTL